MSEEHKSISGVSEHIFKQFLGSLKKEKVEEDIIAKLKNSLIDESDTSEKSIRQAIFPDNNVEL